jgi:hypothetical protein
MKHNESSAQHFKLCVEYRTPEVDDQVAQGDPWPGKYEYNIKKNRGAKIFQNSDSQLKILGAGEVTRSNFHIEGPHILGTTNSIITTTRRPSFWHP